MIKKHSLFGIAFVLLLLNQSVGKGFGSPYGHNILDVFHPPDHRRFDCMFNTGGLLVTWFKGSVSIK